VVTLKGKVKTTALEQSAAEAALKIAGVKSVQNNLQVAAEKR
jgi:osmotically-inducible protein OsmY